MNSIEMVFDGEWKSPEEYLMRCPYCDDHSTHNHCYVNVVKGVFICHRCGESGPIERLMADHGGGEKIERGPGIIEKQRHEPLDLGKFKLVTGITSTLDRLAFAYLQGRGFTRQEINTYGVKFGDFGKLYGRVIFPITEADRDVCFSARSFMKAVYPKYLFPRHGETILTTNECLWGWDWAMEATPEEVIITEGVIDAISLRRFGKGSVSIHSKQIGDAQLLKLLRLPKHTRFIVMLDGDALQAGLKVAKGLKDFGRDTLMSLLDEDEDPATISELRFKEVLENNTFPVDVNLAMRVYLQ